MLVMDLDRTLLDLYGQISDNSKNYLLKLKEIGYIIVIATGRIFDSAISATDGAKFANYIISSSGALIYDLDNKKEILRKTISADDIEDICNLYDDNFEYIDICDSHYYYKYTTKEYTKNRFSRLINNYDELINCGQIVTMTIKMNKNIEDIIDFLNSNIKDVDAYIMIDSVNQKNKWIEIVGKGVTKYKSIRVISDLVGIDNENIISFGDSINDIDMIANSGIGVAMKNALQDVKTKADFITDFDNDQDGVVRFLERYLNL